jgi:farnesyl-diphosphate farnesyltransferase
MTQSHFTPSWDTNPLSGFRIDNAQIRYLEDQMKKVSRSFALVVSHLEQPLREFLSAAYLICRVVDNIEDTTEPFEWQRQRFDDFFALLDAPARAVEILARWGAERWPGLTDDERRLMGPEHGTTLWQNFNALPDRVRQVIVRWARDMAQGMSEIEDPGRAPLLVRRGQVQMLAAKQDYDRYCYYVAGTVGHLATEMAVDFYSLDGQQAGQLFDTCEACGRGLQKTNIVKDFQKDLARGVSYLPDEWLGQVDYQPLSLAGAPAAWKRLVIGDVLADLREATRYVLALPYEVLGYRIASLLCLLPAYQTLLRAGEQARNLFTAAHNIKISRLTMMSCIRDARSLVNDNQAILAYSLAAEESILSSLA